MTQGGLIANSTERDSMLALDSSMAQTPSRTSCPNQGHRLFVNRFQNTTSLSTNNGAEEYSMRRVVQHSCRNQIQRQKRRKLDHLKGGAAREIARYEWKQRSPTNDVEDKARNEEETAGKPLVISKRTEPARPLSALSGNDLSFDSQAMITLQFYLRSWERRPQAYRQFFALGLTPGSCTSVDAVEKLCWSQDTHMLAVMAYTATLYRHLHVIPISNAQADRILQKALQGVRKSLNSSDADATGVLFDSAYLSLLAAYQGEHAAATVHLSAINKLIPVLGGMNNIPTYLSGLFLFADYFLAMQGLSRPVIEEQFQQNWTIPAPVKLVNSRLTDVGREVLQSGWLTTLASDLQRIVGRMIRCMQILEHAWSDPAVAINGYWARRECMVLINLLLIKRNAKEDPPIPKSENRERRFHHKTRDGCSTCRARHIKCDEGKPACQKCLSRGFECGGYDRPKPKIFQSKWSASPSPSVSPQSDTVAMAENPSPAKPRSASDATILAFWTAIILATTHDLSGARNCLPKISASVVNHCAEFGVWNETLTGEVEDMDDFMRRLYGAVSRAEPLSGVKLEGLMWVFLLQERFNRSKHEQLPSGKAMARIDGHWWSSSVLLR